jgi:hypothetical protein
MTVTLPIIHMNGTGRDVLLQEYQLVQDISKALRVALQQATLHGRDFYPLGDSAYPAACEERAAIFKHLDAVGEYADGWVEHLHNQK